MFTVDVKQQYNNNNNTSTGPEQTAAVCPNSLTFYSKDMNDCYLQVQMKKGELKNGEN